MKKLYLIFVIALLISTAAHSLNLSTKYFSINFEKADRYYAKRVVALVDDIYEQINADMGLSPKGKIDLYIARTEEKFAKFYGRKPAPEIVAFARSRPSPMLVIKSPHIARGIDLRPVLAHELAHLVLAEYLKGKDLPRWLNEGFAMYESRELRLNHYALVASASIRGDLLTLEGLDYAFYAEGSRLDLAYAQSYYLMSYIIGNYGPDKFRALIDAYAQSFSLKKAIQQSLGVPIAQFDREWRKSIKGRYFVASVIAYSSPVWIMLILAGIGYLFMRERNRRVQLKWQIEEMFEQGGEL